MKLPQEKSDEALCVLAVAGDREAEECLAARYRWLVRACARPYFLVGGDSEDLIQEGMIGLLSAIRGYLPEQEVRFRFYGEICIRNRLRSAVRTAARDKHNPLNHALSLDPSLFDEGATPYVYGGTALSSTDDPEQALISREEQEARMNALHNKLSGFERSVLDFYLNGLSYVEIAERVNKSLKSVDNAIQRIRRKVSSVLISGDISIS